MKLIIAIIKPFKLETVKDALENVGVNGMTTFDVRGFGKQKGHSEIFRGSEYSLDFLPKITLLIAVEDREVEAACGAIRSSAMTGKLGDGRIMVLGMEAMQHIRTGEVIRSAELIQAVEAVEPVGNSSTGNLLWRYENFLEALCGQDVEYKQFKAVPTDKNQELKLHLRKCKEGISQAFVLAGICFHVGKNTVNDAIQAYMHYNIATLLGISEAGDFRSMISASMTSEEISQAQGLTRKFVARHLPQAGAVLGLESES